MSAHAQDVLDYSWLHDDLEDDLLGAEWHQSAIRALVISLKTLAQEQFPRWHVGDQVTLVAWKPDHTDWRPAPDVVIFPHLGPQERPEIDLRQEGPPALIVEVASVSTWDYDVSMERARRGRRQAGKAYGYMVGLGVAEYLVFDPYGEYIAGQCRAWRHAGDVAEEWRPEPDGRYRSAALGISLQPDGALLRVIDPAGHPVPYWYEAAQRNVALQQEAATLHREREAQAERIAALEAELERLRRPQDG